MPSGRYRARCTALRCGKTWHAVWGPKGSAAKGLQVTGKVIPPRTMKAIRLRYPWQVQLDELFAINVESAIVRVGDQSAT